VSSAPLSGRSAISALASASFLVALAACSSAPSAPRAVLDEKTGVTINTVAKPLLFARVRTDISGFAHDYVMLVALESDNAGKYMQLFLLYRWPIAGGAEPQQSGQPGGELLIEADGHEIDLHALDRVPIGMTGSKQLFAPQGNDVATFAYRTDFETMRTIAMSHDLSVRMPQEPPDMPFAIWQDGRAALAQLVNQLNGS
jgi:hypothetical protein